LEAASGAGAASAAAGSGAGAAASAAGSGGASASRGLMSSMGSGRAKEAAKGKGSKGKAAAAAASSAAAAAAAANPRPTDRVFVEVPAVPPSMPDADAQLLADGLEETEQLARLMSFSTSRVQRALSRVLLEDILPAAALAKKVRQRWGGEGGRAPGCGAVVRAHHTICPPLTAEERAQAAQSQRGRGGPGLRGAGPAAHARGGHRVLQRRHVLQLEGPAVEGAVY